MTTGCSSVCGLVLLVTIILGSLVAMFAPYWLILNYVDVKRGLLMRCSEKECVWTDQLKKQRQSNNLGDVVVKIESYLDKTMKENIPQYALIYDYPEWYMATQGLMSLGLGLGLIALLIATLSLCCTCHKCNPHPPICGLLACAGLAMGVACIVFGVKANQTWNIKLEWDTLTSGRFGWSYWVAVSASVLSLLTSGIYGCIGRSSDR